MAKNENNSHAFIRKMVENIKQTKDAQGPDDPKMNEVSDTFWLEIAFNSGLLLEMNCFVVLYQPFVELYVGNNTLYAVMFIVV